MSITSKPDSKYFYTSIPLIFALGTRYIAPISLKRGMCVALINGCAVLGVQSKYGKGLHGSPLNSMIAIATVIATTITMDKFFEKIGRGSNLKGMAGVGLLTAYPHVLYIFFYYYPGVLPIFPFSAA